MVAPPIKWLSFVCLSAVGAGLMWNQLAPRPTSPVRAATRRTARPSATAQRSKRSALRETTQRAPPSQPPKAPAAAVPKAPHPAPASEPSNATTPTFASAQLPLPIIEEPETCDTEVRLAATFRNERRPERSFALLYPPSSKTAAVYRAGMRIGEYVVSAIHPRAVLLTDPQTVCWLRLTRAPSRRHARARHASRSKHRSAKKSLAKSSAWSAHDLDRGIHRVNATHYRVDRNFLKRLLASASSAFATASTRLAMRGGVATGLQVRRVDKLGIGSRLGVRNGDVLGAVNGYSLTTPEGLLHARKQITTEGRIALTLRRHGKATVIQYDVR